MTADKVWTAAMRLGAVWGCHQLPDRSFFLHGYQFPLCARCTGVVLGHILALFTRPLPKFAPTAFLAVMLCDWVRQELGESSTNIRRLLTGILAGLAVGDLERKCLRAVVIRKYACRTE